MRLPAVSGGGGGRRPITQRTSATAAREMTSQARALDGKDRGIATRAATTWRPAGA